MVLKQFVQVHLLQLFQEALQLEEKEHLLILWESSTTSASSGFRGWKHRTNNAIDYNSSSLTATTWFRRVVEVWCLSFITSSAIEVTVNPVISNNTISSAQTIYVLVQHLVP